MKGFTFIETIVAIAIFALAMGATAAAVMMTYRTHGYTREQSIAIDEARRGIKTMVKEIREAQSGEDGSYPIEKAGDKEFIFHSDVDQDQEVERVRYFLGSAGSDSKTKEDVTFSDGGSCQVTFSNFLTGNLTSAEVKVSVEGDLGWSREYAEIYADGNYLDNSCKTQCSDCAGSWEGTATFDVTDLAKDDYLELRADATGWVNDFCDWKYSNHALLAKFTLSWTEDIPQGEGKFKKGIIEPSGDPPSYSGQEKVEIISRYVRNAPPIFEYYYFDESQDQLKKIEDYPARLKDTELMRVYLEVNVDPDQIPNPFELESYAQIRNL